MKLPEGIERFGWGVLLTIGPYIVGVFIYAGLTLLLDAKANDHQGFMIAGVLAATYRALEADWIDQKEPYSAAQVVQNLTVALVAGAISVALHSVWAFFLLDWLNWTAYIGIPAGLVGGAIMVMNSPKDLSRLRYRRRVADEADD